jgi:ribosomal protein L11 methyltransferase
MDYSPFTVGDRFRIVPPGSAPVAGRLELRVARGAFGSGEHDTTRSSLELLERLAPELAGVEVLDLGAGTGILAIGALLLGARHAVLVDNDARAAASSREHLALNGVADRATVVEGELGSVAGRFGLILANIHGDILLRVADELVARARPGASLVLSGILWELNWDVRDRYERLGCEVRANRFLEEHSTVLLRRAGNGGESESGS